MKDFYSNSALEIIDSDHQDPGGRGHLIVTWRGGAHI